ncbi:MAG: DUF3820 family protein [Deltaproteobacteria bacterium]|jgi:exodeoxyribonuclease X|nr:DUF3820 family protein [Deltaproteobacteria bacterium]
METKLAVILDTETTGIIEPVLIEAGMIIIDGSPSDNQNKTFIKRYNPGKPISYGAMATHGILDEDLKDCPPASEFCLPENTGYIIGHNVDYDWSVIGKPDVKRIDTLAMAKAVWEGFDAYNLSALSYALTEPDKRAKLREFLAGRHNALTDAKLCLNILRLILKEKPELNSWGSIWRFSEESRIPRVMPFGKHKGTPIKDVPQDYKDWLKGQADIDEYLLIALNGVDVEDTNKGL